MVAGTSGVVLAGGHSRRFGADKRSVEVGGVPLLRRAVDAVARVADDVTVATAADRPIPDAVVLPPGTRVVEDEPEATGPLAGLAAGLAAAQHELVVVLAGDHAWADPATLAELRDQLAEDDTLDAVVAYDGRPQPLVAAYRRRVLATVRARLADGDPRAVALLDHLTVAHVTVAPGLEATIRDVDTPADLAANAHRHAASIGNVQVTRISADGTVSHAAADVVTGEEPLAIRIAGPDGVSHEVTTTLRTPGHDLELAVGFLFSEGLLGPGDVTGSSIGDALTDARPDDTITIGVRVPVDIDALVHRHVTATASCGICGRATIDDLLARVSALPEGPTVPWATLVELPDRLRTEQATFDATGGLHATGIATTDGRLVTVREDVGRHNALDAAIGAHVLAGTVPLTDHLVVLSGRVGFELVQKIAVAGATIVVAVGAPTDLAVRTADEVGLTLVGFVRGGGGNVYTHRRRIELPG